MQVTLYTTAVGNSIWPETRDATHRS